MILKDAVTVITGSSSGLGAALARVLAGEGARVVLSSRSSSEAELKKIAADLNAEYCLADVTNEEDVINLADFAVKQFGRIDLWINNAGIWIPHAPIEEMNMKGVHDMVEVNLFGTIYGSKAALIQMKKQQSGYILNILSVSALEGHVGSAGYGASKSGAAAFTKVLRKEAAPFGVQVLEFYPGGMRTNLFEGKMPTSYDQYMDRLDVARKVIDNLKLDEPVEELIIRHL